MSSQSINIKDIQKKIPHRFPFLLVDRILSFEQGPDPKSGSEERFMQERM